MLLYKGNQPISRVRDDGKITLPVDHGSNYFNLTTASHDIFAQTPDIDLTLETKETYTLLVAYVALQEVSERRVTRDGGKNSLPP